MLGAETAWATLGVTARCHDIIDGNRVYKMPVDHRTMHGSHGWAASIAIFTRDLD